mmetsp:Transcript_45394/g.97017  ORF Transcript_45394/g.97017 Transcript_45394/m.97017 type:complete len:293 (+) Transcript_45394:1498-2376(+)
MSRSTAGGGHALIACTTVSATSIHQIQPVLSAMKTKLSPSASTSTLATAPSLPSPGGIPDGGGGGGGGGVLGRSLRRRPTTSSASPSLSLPESSTKGFISSGSSNKSVLGKAVRKADEPFAASLPFSGWTISGLRPFASAPSLLAITTVNSLAAAAGVGPSWCCFCKGLLGKAMSPGSVATTVMRTVSPLEPLHDSNLSISVIVTSSTFPLPPCSPFSASASPGASPLVPSSLGAFLALASLPLLAAFPALPSLPAPAVAVPGVLRMATGMLSNSLSWPPSSSNLSSFNLPL